MYPYERHLKEAAVLYTALTTNETFSTQLQALSDMTIGALNKGKTILVAGNGGSAAEAQHLAAELVGRYKTERRGLPSIALTTDTSILTAVGNDYSFNDIFSRQVEALGKEGDVLVLLSTSGNSENLMRAAARARSQGVKTAALLGKGGGSLAQEVDLAIIVPSDDTPRIQEVQLLVIHALCNHVDEVCGK